MTRGEKASLETEKRRKSGARHLAGVYNISVSSGENNGVIENIFQKGNIEQASA